MDLGAYANIEKLGVIAAKNGIEIPRCRGYRLMKDEEPISAEKLDEMMRIAAVAACEYLCDYDPHWTLYFMEYARCERRKNRFLYRNPNPEESDLGVYVGIRWDRIHGKKRKILKFKIKKKKKMIQRQFAAWNKYAGREDVLYIHSRMGGYNWLSFDGKDELMNQPWFLDRVDDWWDCTYCDFYARIDDELGS